LERLTIVNWESEPFGAEYAWRPTWGFLERFYVSRVGLLDFPSRIRARVILRELKILRPQKVLDLGSGTGCYCFYLSRDQRIDVTGIEIDETRISESSYITEHLGRRNLKFQCGGADRGLQGFPPEAFEVALVVELLQYLANIPSILWEIYRVLKPGGYLVGHVPALGYLRHQEKTLFDDDKIGNILSDANFRIIKIEPTFGGMLRRLCALYDSISRLRLLAAAVFPIFLSFSHLFRVENPDGQYRFFVARKPTQ
jgi:SAM-dependent methyltransferase